MDSLLEMFEQCYSDIQNAFAWWFGSPVGLSLGASKMDTNMFDRHVRMHAALGSA
jgi:hypothetical protein